MRVLIAEDDLRIAHLLQCGLQEEGCRVTTETDGTRFLRMASALPFSCSQASKVSKSPAHPDPHCS